MFLCTIVSSCPAAGRRVSAADDLASLRKQYATTLATLPDFTHVQYGLQWFPTSAGISNMPYASVLLNAFGLFVATRVLEMEQSDVARVPEGIKVCHGGVGKCVP
jgi:hypothetical protein